MTSCGASVLSAIALPRPVVEPPPIGDDAIRVVLVEDRQRLLRHLDRRVHGRAEEVADRKVAEDARDALAGILLLRRGKHERALAAERAQHLGRLGEPARAEDHALRTPLVDEGLDPAAVAHRSNPKGGAQPPFRIMW